MNETHDTHGATRSGRDIGRGHGPRWLGWDRLDALWWALVLTWGALVLILDSTSLPDRVDWWDRSGVFWVGVGSLALIGIPIRLVVRRYRSKLGWTLFWASLFLAVGLGELAGRAWHALPLVTIAGLILVGTANAGGRRARHSSQRFDGHVESHTR